MAKDKSWPEAIRIVLERADEPLHYKRIAEEVAAQGLRTKFGATPADTVASRLTTSLRDANSPFVRVGRGLYTVKSRTTEVPSSQEAESDKPDQAGVIRALGMFWRASEVEWTTRPKLLGAEQQGATEVDFCEQVGIYLLHDVNRVLYVGRSVDRPLGVRLAEHTKDRLGGRWDRFSWFGLRGVTDSAKLAPMGDIAIDGRAVIAALEAVLIESLEPPQNRKRGDDLSAVEFQQVSDATRHRRDVDAVAQLVTTALMQRG